MRKKILSMSIAAVLTAVTSSSVMAFDSEDNKLDDAVDMSSSTIKPAHIIVQHVKVNKDNKNKDKDKSFEGYPAAYVGDDTLINGVKHPPVASTEDLIVNASPRINGTYGGGALTRKGDALVFPLFTAGKKANATGKPLLEEITCDKTTDELKLPKMEAAEGWSTEFVVRNTDTKHAIVAKVAFYSQLDTEELLDFNIYLSAFDVARFKIERVKDASDKYVTRVTSTDGSVPYYTSKPENGVDNDQVIFAAPKSATEDARTFVRDMPESVGYAVVYGMGQASNRVSTTSLNDLRYDHEHQQLFKNYRAELDVCRPNWRKGHRNSMAVGTYIPFERNATNMPFYVPAPNVAESCNDSSGAPLTGAVPGNLFGDVAPSLTGTVRIYNKEEGEERDMLLPATAIENFTAGNKIIYAEGEIAALQDRRIHGDSAIAGAPKSGKPASCASNATTGSYTGIDWAYYDEAGIQRDANPFLVKQTVYKFAKLPDNVKNTLVVTQPYKRILVQTGNDDRYWKGFACDNGTPDAANIDGKKNYGGIIMRYVIYDEDEHRTANVVVNSPFGQNEGSWPYEVQAFSDLEKNITIDRYTDQNTGRITTVLREMTAEEIAEQAAGTKDYSFNGFGLVTLVGNEGSPSSLGNNGGLGVPAIVTQMVATNVGGKGKLNWIYSETK